MITQPHQVDTTHLWPVAIVEDRYGGAYSRGRWLAIAEADYGYRGQSRISWVLSEGPHGDDCDAMEFWSDPPPWIAVGRTPDEALSALASATASPDQPQNPTQGDR